MNRLRVVVLTSWGHKTGLPRHTAIEYRAHGSKMYLLSGWGQRPHWISNLVEQPVVRVRQGKKTLNTRATIVTDDSETLRALYLFRKRAPFIYDPIFARLSNRESVNLRTLPEIASQFTIIRLDPSENVVGPPTVDADLRWVWAILGIGLTLLAGLAVKRSRIA
jgi:deazaflavin-dependent oxidoreductase (nitroreductase family)